MVNLLNLFVSDFEMQFWCCQRLQTLLLKDLFIYKGFSWYFGYALDLQSMSRDSMLSRWMSMKTSGHCPPIQTTRLSGNLGRFTWNFLKMTPTSWSQKKPAPVLSSFRSSKEVLCLGFGWPVTATSSGPASRGTQTPTRRECPLSRPSNFRWNLKNSVYWNSFCNVLILSKVFLHFWRQYSK